MYNVACWALAATAAAVAARLWIQRGWGASRELKKGELRGRTALITGASSGLGKETAEALAAAGARVIFAVRDLEAAKRVVDDIRRRRPDAGEMIPMRLDLASLDSVRSFSEVVKTACTKIDILILNAGVYLPTDMLKTTVDGFEPHFAVNHLGHFLLTKLLLDLVKEANGRIVIVSSLLHERGTIDLQRLNPTDIRTNPPPIKGKSRQNPGYCNTKLMNVYFGRALTERTEELGIDVFTLCPGFTYTNLFRYSLKWYHFIAMLPIVLFYLRTPKQGAQTILYCATDPTLKGRSGFYRNCAPYRSKVMFDKQIEERLWDLSEELISLKRD